MSGRMDMAGRRSIDSRRLDDDDRLTGGMTDWKPSRLMKYADCVHDGERAICHTDVNVSLNRPIARLAATDRQIVTNV